MGSRGQYKFWFPLVLLGFLALGGIALAGDRYQPLAFHQLEGLGPGGIYGTGVSQAYQSVMVLSSVSPVAVRTYPGEYWVAGVLVILLATAVWYAWRSGQERTFAFLGLAGVVAAVGFLVILEIVLAQPALAPTIGGSLLAVGLCGAAWVYFRLGGGRRVVAGISVVVVATGGVALLINVTPVRPDQWIVVCGLLVLAGLERSLFLAAVALVYFVVAWAFLPGVTGLVLTAAVLFFGGVSALVLKKSAVTA